jgi:phage terminase large subunit-like protein
MSIDESGMIYVEHVARGQWESYKRDLEIVKMGKLDKELRTGHTVIWHFQDPGSAGLDSAKATNALIAEAGLEGHYERVTGSKEVRAGPWSSALEAGKVKLVLGGWNDRYIEEHVAFPKGKFKDQVDASAGAFSKLKSGSVEGQLFY